MSTLSSASTDAAVQSSIDDNASYEEDASVAKAKAYTTALLIQIGRLRKRAKTSDAGSSIEASIESYQSELNRAREWLSSYDSATQETLNGPQVIHADLSGFRD